MPETDCDIPSHLQQLLRERVRSIDRLLVLVLVHSEPTRFWSPREIAQSLRMSVESLETPLEKLVASGLFQREQNGSVRFRPEPPGLASDIAALADLYRSNTGDVLVFLSDLAISRVRNAARQTFSEAFRFRRGKVD